jgi:hypothetical protein
MLKIRSFKRTHLIISLILIGSLFSCSSENPQTEGQITNEQTTGIVTQTPENTTVQTQEEQLTEKLLKEEGVNTGKIYIMDNIVYCAIIVKEDSNTENAKKLAQRYADELKEIYKDKKINVQAVQKDKSIANIQE